MGLRVERSGGGGGGVKARGGGNGEGGSSRSGRGELASEPWRTYRCVRGLECPPLSQPDRAFTPPHHHHHHLIATHHHHSSQDVLEDVTYMNAMSDDSPKPTKAWDLPDEAALADFCSRELTADPQAFALEKICQNSLGFYLVRACAGVGDGGGMMHVWRWTYLSIVTHTHGSTHCHPSSHHTTTNSSAASARRRAGRRTRPRRASWRTWSVTRSVIKCLPMRTLPPLAPSPVD